MPRPLLGSMRKEERMKTERRVARKVKIDVVNSAHFGSVRRFVLSLAFAGLRVVTPVMM